MKDWKRFALVAGGVLVAVVLAVVLWCMGGDSEGEPLPSPVPSPSVSVVPSPQTPTPVPSVSPPQTSVSVPSASPTLTPASVPSASPTLTPTPTPSPSSAPLAPSPVDTPVPIVSPTPTPTPKPSEAPATLHCSISIRCDTILNNMDLLDPEKIELVPPDGVLLSDSAAAFEEGESAFDLLKRVCREKGVHLEFSITPGYGSAYVEGIGNLYEFDCGERSGWLYRVNGQVPDRGCSEYLLQPEDKVEFLYSCDWGQDLT